MNIYTVINHKKRHLDLTQLKTVDGFDQNQPTKICFTADVDGNWGEGHTVCLEVTVNPECEIIDFNTPKRFAPYKTPPIIINGVLYANQEFAEKLQARRAKSLELIAADDFLHIPRTGDMWKITGIDDDFFIKVIDAAGNSDWINPITTPVESHSGWNWRGRD